MPKFDPEDIIDIPLCAECHEKPVLPPKRKYCSDECAKEAQRKQQADYMQKKRNDGDVESSVESSLKVPPEKIQMIQTALVHNTPTALVEYLREAEEERAVRIVQKAIAPQLLEVINRLVRVETSQEELKSAFPITPALAKKHPWREWAIRKAMQILETYRDTPLGEYRNKYLLVERIQEALACTDHTAIEMMKLAEKRIQRFQRDPSQSSMEDYPG